MAKPNLSKGGIITNLDIEGKVDAAQRAQTEQEEFAQSVVDDAVAEARRQGGGDTFKVGTANEFDSGQLKVDVTYSESQKTDRELGNSSWVGQPAMKLTPGGPFNWVWHFGDERKVEAVQEGRFCPNCLQPQKNILDPKCEWANGNSSVVKGCGYNALDDDVLPWDM